MCWSSPPHLLLMVLRVQQGRCVTVSGKAYNPNTHRKTDSRQTHTETFYGLSQPAESEASHWGIVWIGSTWFLLQPDHVHSHKGKHSETRDHTSGSVSPLQMHKGLAPRTLPNCRHSHTKATGLMEGLRGGDISQNTPMCSAGTKLTLNCKLLNHIEEN